MRVFANKYPAFAPKAEAALDYPPFLAQPARGEHEVIVTSPDHDLRWNTFSVEHGRLVLEAVSRREFVLSGFRNRDLAALPRCHFPAAAVQ